MKKVLFVCLHNSARSQMAEAYLNKFGKGEFIAESAGIEPTEINKFVVKVLKEEGIDISNKKAQKVFDLYKDGKIYNYIISVCDEAKEKCPIFPGINKRIAWSFENPANFIGSEEEILEKVRIVRDEIKNKILEFIKEENNK